MNWLLIAFIAQIVLGTSAVFDKLLLKRKFFDPLVYTFWLGLLGIFSLIILPFGFSSLEIGTIITALFAGALFVLAMLFLFYALDYSEASSTLPVIGGFSPVFTLIISYFLLGSFLGFGEFVSFCFLVLGGIVLFLVEKKELRTLSFVLILGSSLFFGLSNVLSKIVFQAGPFVSGFIWIKIGGVLFVLLLLLRKSFRQRIFSSTRQTKTTHHFLYFTNRAYAGLGSILVYFAISLAHPALVDATQSLKYIIIFFFAWILLKERFKGKILTGKIIATFFIALGILWLALVNYSQNIPLDPKQNIEWNLTFSTKFSRQLGLDWQKNFEAILDEIKPSKIRLVAYWDEIEKEPGQFDFSETDWLIQKTQEKNIPVILTVGLKVPRWPECHEPKWAKLQNSNDKLQSILIFIEKAVERYKNYPNLYAWQVENEPFLFFGECGTIDKKILDEEISLVKSLDPEHPILITDGGEAGLWYKAARRGDIFGTTMYRNVYPRFIGPIFGNIEYPISPAFFRIKEKITRFLINDYSKRFIVIELQAEPWSHVELVKTPIEEQIKLFSPEYFKDTIRYAKETGFDEYYLWGAEWWYWMKENQDHPEYWEEARDLLLTH
ncbi:EamA family transporter [Patescibacteria group bacterium]|nr:EamA family transporter [Patescibacteria group bacterium]MBU2219068.1 EamA family transporter [Patescibacteria group bacterium]